MGIGVISNYQHIISFCLWNMLSFDKKQLKQNTNPQLRGSGYVLKKLIVYQMFKDEKIIFKLFLLMLY